jgi:hypothetical protein
MVNSPTFVGRARRSESRFHSDFAAGRGWGRLGRFTGVGGVCDQLRGWLAQQKINTGGYLAGSGLGMLMKLLFSDH